MPSEFEVTLFAVDMLWPEQVNQLYHPYTPGQKECFVALHCGSDASILCISECIKSVHMRTTARLLISATQQMTMMTMNSRTPSNLDPSMLFTNPYGFH